MGRELSLPDVSLSSRWHIVTGGLPKAGWARWRISRGILSVEHVALDFAALREFMRGLVDAGPTPSGHRTPTVIVSLPLLGLDEATVTAGGWMVQQALARASTASTSPAPATPKESSASSRPPATRSANRPSTSW